MIPGQQGSKSQCGEIDTYVDCILWNFEGPSGADYLKVFRIIVETGRTIESSLIGQLDNELANPFWKTESGGRW